MKKLIFVLASFLALAFFVGCSNNSDSTGGAVVTGKTEGVFSASNIVPSVSDPEATVTSTFSSEGSSVSWSGNEFTLYIQVISKVDSHAGGIHSTSTNNSPLIVGVTKVGSVYKCNGAALNVSGELDSGNFTINGELTLKQSGLLLTPEVTIKFTDLSFKKN